MLHKVDFLVAGVQKGGTTALDAYLRQHPQLCLAKDKEVHFFDNDRRFSGSPDYDWYHSRFPFCSREKLLGETTPAYMFWQEAPGRIRAYNPDIKLIFLLRNPIERAYSHWNMQRVRGRDRRTFLEALQDEERMCRETRVGQCREYSYLARGFYTEQIRRFRYHFPRQQMLFLKSDRFQSTPEEGLRQIFAFLGVPHQHVKPLGEEQSHAGTYRRPMSREEYDYLRFLYEYEILQLERMLNWDCSDWLQ